MICERCDYYDLMGASEQVFIKGCPGCEVCGCKISYKIRSLSSDCGLAEAGKEPKWKAVMSEEVEEKYRTKTGITNE